MLLEIKKMTAEKESSIEESEGRTDEISQKTVQIKRWNIEKKIHIRAVLSNKNVVQATFVICFF